MFVIPAALVVAAARVAGVEVIASNSEASAPRDEAEVPDAPEPIDLAVPPRPIRIDDELDGVTPTAAARSVRTSRRHLPSSPRQRIFDTVERLGRIDGNFHWANLAWQRGDGLVAHEHLRRVLCDAPDNRAAAELMAVVRDADSDEEGALRCRRLDAGWCAVYERYLEPLRFSPTEPIPAELQDGEVREELRLKYLDVKSILAQVPEFRPAEIFLIDSSYVPPDAQDDPESHSPAASLDELIREAVDPESWSEEGTHLALKYGTLIVKSRRGTIERVSQLVYALRASLPPLEPRPDVPFGRPATMPSDDDREWHVVDLVGRASADGTVAPSTDDDPLPPFTPGALLAALRAAIADDAWSRPGSSVRLVDGTLSVHMAAAATRHIGALLEAIRARVDPPKVFEDFDYEVTCD